MFKQAFKHYLELELKELKNHLFGILSVFVKYIVPLIFIFIQGLAKSETKTKLETWAMLPLAFLVIVYFFAIRKAFRSKKVEEHVITRIDSKKAEPLRLAFLCFLDDCIMSPLIPLIFYLMSKNLERLAIKNSTAMLAIFILFMVGGIFKVIDCLLNMVRIYKENYPTEEDTTSKEESENLVNGTNEQ